MSDDLGGFLQEIDITGYWRDTGIPFTFKINQGDHREELDDATYHILEKESSAILFIVKDKNGDKISSETCGRSVIHYITGNKNRYGYINSSEPLNLVRLGPNKNIHTVYEMGLNRRRK